VLHESLVEHYRQQSDESIADTIEIFRGAILIAPLRKLPYYVQFLVAASTVQYERKRTEVNDDNNPT